MKRHALLIPSLMLACGGGSSSSPTTPNVPARTLITQGTAQLADPETALTRGPFCDIFAFVPFATPGPGTLDVTVEWTFATNDVDVFLERGACDCSSAQDGACQDVAGSESTTAKPERLNVPNLSTGSYTLVIGNAGPGRESVSYEIGLTR